MEKTYSAALVGLGKIAWQLGQDAQRGGSLSHAAAFKENTQVTLTAGFDVDHRAVNRFNAATGLPGFDALEKMLLSVRPDIVSICSPTPYHYQHTLSCIEHGVPMIWLEKPPAASAKWIHLLQLEYDNHPKTKILVNYQRRYTGCYKKLRSIIRNAQFGQVLAVDMRYSRGIETNGVHMLDMIFFLFPTQSYRIEWVSKSSQENPSFILRLNSGMHIYMNGIDAKYHNIDVCITCEHSRLSILHGGMTLKIEACQEHELFPGYYRLKDTDPYELGHAGFDFALDIALTDLLNAYAQNREAQSNLLSAVQSQQLLEQIQMEMNR